MERIESTGCSWAWVTVSRALSRGPCELLYAQAISDGGEIKDTLLYAEENATGELIMNFQMGANGNITLSPQTPIYCCRGLYAIVGDSTEGVFVQWRELGHKGGG